MIEIFIDNNFIRFEWDNPSDFYNESQIIVEGIVLTPNLIKNKIRGGTKTFSITTNNLYFTVSKNYIYGIKGGLEFKGYFNDDLSFIIPDKIEVPQCGCID
jgi:hypothetical protein